eukprot:CAMPEP_0202390768 /NCGR_PEP_ID=MMETSP1127-20130417/90456_1 /ASSEMBLY_ACC=CAM_ASM_000462 /TAXON_ID=3047 /ORGANISM="Dunaliella tertiolecta, Strain CCMP1320" /LENGTH=49 /DNA_ID= /DNA_START= /DNA_END= /DNA_ORIENTATION=
MGLGLLGLRTRAASSESSSSLQSPMLLGECAIAQQALAPPLPAAAAAAA